MPHETLRRVQPMYEAALKSVLSCAATLENAGERLLRAAGTKDLDLDQRPASSSNQYEGRRRPPSHPRPREGHQGRCLTLTGTIGKQCRRATLRGVGTQNLDLDHVAPSAKPATLAGKTRSGPARPWVGQGRDRPQRCTSRGTAWCSHRGTDAKVRLPATAAAASTSRVPDEPRLSRPAFAGALISA